ncbi:MAG: hypothetical protein Q9169_005338 [Polycauliona sp. 2 TL-2023]
MAKPASPDIAIIGMACRVAGSNSPSELWDNLLTSRDVQKRIARFNIDGYYHPNGGPLKGLTHVDHAYMLDDNLVDKFDNAFFHVTPTEAASLDPQHRIEGSDYHTVLARDPNTSPKYIVTGTAGCMASNRLSYFYDLSGPSVTVDTACSSSMAALHQAVRALQHGDSSMALVCGANLIFNPESFVTMTELGFLGASGRCRSFDANADGYGRGEGICCVLLIPREQALSVEVPVRAVIKGTRLNQDGRTQGITLPSAKAQAENMNGLYEELGIDISSIQYLEAHGTGTPAGDPLEMQAVKDTYLRHTLIVGSVKGNVGHCEAASALVGLIKTVLCLEHEEIPAQMHFDALNPAVDLTNTNITIPKQILSWPELSANSGCTPRAAINTFGAGGTNGHAVLESFTHRRSEASATQRPWLFTISAANETSLRSLTKAYTAYIESRKPNLRDLAHTLLARRSRLRYSQFVVASTHGSLVTHLSSGLIAPAKTSNPARQLLVVFTGQGAQWSRMGCSLLDQCPSFRSTILECDQALQELSHPPAWSILDELSKTRDQSNIDEAQYSQPLCTALQIALVVLLKRWGVQITAVVGHSSGEIAAAFAAGMISLRDAVVIAYSRGLVLADSSQSSSSTETRGAMCAVDMGEDECNSLLGDYNGQVQLAAVNSEHSRTLSGDRDAIDGIVDICKKREMFCRRLKVDHEYLEKAQVAPLHEDPEVIMFSSVTGRMMDKDDLMPSYWAKNMTSTVQYAAAINCCLGQIRDIDCILEIGPHPILKRPTQEIFHARHKTDVPHISTCMRDTDDFESILRSAGEMIAAGLPLRTAAINTEEGPTMYEPGRILTDLPPYQWNHTASFWSESRVSHNLRNRQYPRHELLGSRYVDDIPSRACWRNQFNPNEIEWLRELEVCSHFHFMAPQVLMLIVQSDRMTALSPAICIVMAAEAARQILMPHDQGKAMLRLINVKFPADLLLPASSGRKRDREVQCISKLDNPASRMTFEIFRADPDVCDGWQLCSTGTLEIAPKLLEVPNHHTGSPHHDPLLGLRANSLDPTVFDVVEGLQIDIGKVSGTIPILQESWQKYAIHPVALASVLSLGPVSLVGQNLPAKQRLSSISVLDMDVNSKSPDLLTFSIDTVATLAGGAMGKIDISDGSSGVLVGAVQYTAAKVIPPRPVGSSLFFKCISLPDITKLTEAHNLSIEECVQLLSHKWPMADVLVDIGTTFVRERLLQAFNSQKPEARKRYRSMLVVGDVEELDTANMIQYVQQISRDMQAHMIFVDKIISIDWLHKHIRPAGLVCNRNVQESMVTELTKHLQSLCELTDGDQRLGTLWQVKDDPSTLFPKPRRVIFSDGNFEIKNSLQITLAPDEVKAFTGLNTSGRFDAIVIDNLEKSIIATWPGSDLIPWLQHLMERADSLLWVTRDASSSPFVDIAGTLLRTLQAEQPSLKVSWLCLDQRERNDVELVKSIEIAYNSMVQGDDEVRLDINQTGTRIIRYQPDEDLAAATGVALPRVVDSSIGGRDYELVLAAAYEPVVHSYDRAPSMSKSVRQQQMERLTLKDNLGNEDSESSISSKVTVMVEASIIDSDDVAAFNGHIQAHESAIDNRSKRSTMALGTFFAGKVLISTVAELPPDSSVIGWTEGAHANILFVPPDQILSISDHDLAYDLTRFASLATAKAVLEGHIRVRRTDRIRLINMGDVIRFAFSAVCGSMGIEITHDKSRSDFCIEISETGDILVDGTPVNIRTHLATCLRTLNKLWRDPSSSDSLNFSKAQFFPLKSYKAAFELAVESKDPVVLLHNDVDNLSHVPIYRPPTRLFNPQGAYIIIGGLGGLGRYTCSWLVDHGATSLYAISRSGISSAEAQSLYDTLNSKPDITLEVIKADACDRTHISSILSSIRAKEPIKAVINMAMLLGDAPMASMTGEEWHRALKVKIESSWNLHEETKGDDGLDAFVLFSSIASVLGNRNQGSYNVGNTFLNALAVWRRREGRTGVAVALGAMTDIGILSTHSTPSTASTLTRSGLTHLTTAHLSKILEAAFYKSTQQLAGNETVPEDAVMVTGLEMWDHHISHTSSTYPGSGNGAVYWRSCPEFSHLATYHSPASAGDGQGGKERAVRDKIDDILERMKEKEKEEGKGKDGEEEVRKLLKDAFLMFLARTLGFPAEMFDEGNALGTYGLDSLSAVGVQYWVWRELTITISVDEIFAAPSIKHLIDTLRERVVASASASASASK